jgi:predicted RNA-binding Zn-ribbon protein involved in translation (DUF1610 family)
MDNKYVEDVCPVCGHDDNNDFDYGIADVNMSESVSQLVECEKCGAEWIQVYEIVYKYSQIRGK